MLKRSRIFRNLGQKWFAPSTAHQFPVAQNFLWRILSRTVQSCYLLDRSAWESAKNCLHLIVSNTNMWLPRVISAPTRMRSCVPPRHETSSLSSFHPSRRPSGFPFRTENYKVSSLPPSLSVSLRSSCFVVLSSLLAHKIPCASSNQSWSFVLFLTRGLRNQPTHRTAKRADSY